MANRIKIARGSQNNLPAALTPDSLLYGELYWAKAQTGVSDGVLYMGHSDGVEDGTHDKAPMPVAGARAMKSLYFEGLHDPSSGAYPTGAIVGSFWIASADGTGAASTFHYGDWMICIVVNPNGSTQWIKSINQAITTTNPLDLQKNPLDLTAGVISLKYDGTTLTVDASGNLVLKTYEAYVIATGSIADYLAVAIDSTGKAILADNATEAAANVVGISLSTDTSGDGALQVQKTGRVTHSAWAFADIGGPVYLGTAGALLQGTESILSGQIAIQIGTAISASILEINIGTPFLMDLPPDIYYIPLTASITQGDVAHAPTSDAVYRLISGNNSPTFSDITPSRDNVFDIGEPSFRWANIYANEIHAGTNSVFIGTLALEEDINGNFTVSATTTSGDILSTSKVVLESALTSGTLGITAGGATVGYVAYNGTTQAAGKLDGGSMAPAHTTRLNYDGNLYATGFIGKVTTGVAGLTLTVGTAVTGDGTLFATSGTPAPAGITKAVWDGNFYATNFYGNGSNITNLSASALSAGFGDTTNPYAAKAVNLVLASPGSGSTAGIPGFRSLVAADLPLQTSGGAAIGAVAYNGTTQATGQFDGGSTTPAHSTRLNYDGAFYATSFNGPLTGNVTGNASGTAATVTGAAQANITSVGSAANTLTITGTGGLALTAGDATTGAGTLFVTSGTPAPVATTKGVWDGNFYATAFYGSGANLGLSAVAGNIAPSAANSLDLGASGYSFRSLYLPTNADYTSAGGIYFVPVGSGDTARIYGALGSGATEIHVNVAADADDAFIIESGATTKTALFKVDGGGTVSIRGNLVVSGTTSTVNSATLQVADQDVIINYTAVGIDPLTDSGMRVRRIKTSVEGDNDASLLLNASDKLWYAASGGGVSSKIMLANNAVAAGSAAVAFVGYNGTTQAAGKFDGGSTLPAHNDRLNYDGSFYAHYLNAGTPGLNLAVGTATAAPGTLFATSATPVISGTTKGVWDGILYATGFNGPLTGNASGSAATVTGATQASITSVGSAANTLTIAGTGGLALTVGSATTGAGTLFATSGTPAPVGTTKAVWDGAFYATTIINAVWNDIADCIEVPDDFVTEAGRVYVMNDDGTYNPSIKYLDDGIMGVASDTYGFKVGAKQGNELPVAIGGFVLAYVDKTYKVGTPLTAGPKGTLTEILLPDKRDYPEKVIATFWKPELSAKWNGVLVNDRSWVKVR